MSPVPASEGPVVFSLFNRKERAETKRTREAVLARAAESRLGSPTDTIAAQREAARRTEAKIDQIESEMIAAAAVARVGNGSAKNDRPGPGPEAPAPAQAAARAGGSCRARAEENGTSLLGDAAGAMAIDVNGPALPGRLEEAAILYSNGQSQPAALVLRQALDDPELAGYQPLAWLMLLDLYQCLGDRTGFESLALDYAARFESSPPGWSEALSQSLSNGRAAASGPRVDPAKPVLSLPAAIDASIGETIARFLRSAAGRELELDCMQLVSLDAAAAEALMLLFAHFERSTAVLVLRGAERLLGAARASIEPGRRDPSEAGWMLSLQALRALGRKQDFEDLSIEYCVTYEVSPPSWEPVGPRLRLAETPTAGLPMSVVPAGAQAGAFALRGEVLGRMQAELQALRAFASGRGDVVVDCRGLRRMEFVAAGDLLNEVVTMRSAGRQMLFVEPNYLVYALMLAMGIQELAEIRRRKV